MRKFLIKLLNAVPVEQYSSELACVLARNVALRQEIRALKSRSLVYAVNVDTDMIRAGSPVATVKRSRKPKKGKK